VSPSGRSLGAKCRDPLFGETLQFVLGDRLSVGFGESLPNEVGEFIFGQLAVFIGVGRGEQGVEPRLGVPRGHSGHLTPAPATPPVPGPLTATMRGERPAAAEVMMTESATGLRVPGEAVLRKSAVSEFVMASHRMSRETPTLAAAVMPTAMPTVMVPSTMVTMADPTACCTSATLAATCPTAIRPAMTIPAVMAVTDEFKVLPSAEPLGVPATTHIPTGAIKSLVSRIAPGERRSVAGAHDPCAAVWAKTVWTARTRSPAPRRSSAFTSAISPFPSFRSARAGFPGDFAIRAAHRAALATRLAAFLAVSPIGVTGGTLLSRVAPFRSFPTFTIDSTATLAHALFVTTLFVPAHIPLFAGLIVALRGLVRAMPTARGSGGRLLRPAMTACRTTLLRAGLVAVRVFVRGVGHFVCSNFAYRIGSPTVLRRKLQCGRCRDPTEKHQRVTAHRTLPRHLECRLLLRIDAVTDLGSHPALAPNGRSRPRLGANISQITLTEDEAAQCFLVSQRIGRPSLKG
jgi:hypothetical protein